MAEKTDLTVRPIKVGKIIDSIDEEHGAEIVNNPNGKLLNQMRRRMNRCHQYWDPIFKASKEDFNFIYNDQWEPEVRQARQNLPQLMLNQLDQYVNQVYGEALQSKISIHISQVGGDDEPMASYKGETEYTKSDILEGLIRDIEYRCSADVVYCIALLHAVEGGIGWLRVRTEYRKDDPFSIDLVVDNIMDRYSAFIDPYATSVDYSDARYCAVYASLEKAEFEAEYPHAQDKYIGNYGLFGSGRIPSTGFWREEPDSVKVVDYWYKQAKKKTAVEFIKEDPQTAQKDRIVLFQDEHEDIFDEVQKMGYDRKRETKFDGYDIMYMRATHNMILDKPEKWPSLILPIIPVTGKRVTSDRDTSFISLTRYSKDPQRMYNFWFSKATERIASAPKEPFIVDAASIAPYEDAWNNAGQSNDPFLPYDSKEGVAPPYLLNSSAIASGEMMMYQAAKGAVQDSIGMHDASLGKKSNEVSGAALDKRSNQVATGTAVFQNNLKLAVSVIGKIIADMIPRLYNDDYARIVRLSDDTATTIQLSRMVVDDLTGKEFRINQLGMGSYTCRATIGPSTLTQRREMLETMMMWSQTDPEAGRVIRDLIVSNMDIVGAKPMAMRFKKMLDPKLLSEEDRRKMPQPEPTIAEQLQQQSLQVEMMKMETEKMLSLIHI